MEELLEKTEELTEKMGQETTEETTVEAAQQSQPETAALEQELEELREQISRLAPDAEAYTAIKDRTAGVELEAHRRAQSVEARAKIMAGDLQRQMEQWAARTEEQYAALKGQIDSSVEQANKEILAASQSLAAMTQLVEQQQAALHAVAETYVLNVRGKKAE